MHPIDVIENRAFDEIKLDDIASLIQTLSREDIDLFTAMSSDVNPAHIDEVYAHSEKFHS